MAALDLEWIAVFDEIYKTANVSRAAERLGMTQGAASTALNRLRVFFDDQLFSRTARGMMPTPRATELFPHLHEVVEALEKARAGRGVFVPEQAQRMFRICMTDISEIVLLPLLLNHLRTQAPGVRIEVEKIGSESPRRLEDGEVDLAVGFMPQLEAGFYQQVLFSQNFVCVFSKAHPRIGTRLSKPAFAREGHVVVGASGTGNVIIEKVLAKAGVQRNIALLLPSFLGVARIVAQTELLAIVPTHYGVLLQEQGAIRSLPVPHPLPDYDIKQHWHQRFHNDPGNIWLRRVVASLFTGLMRSGKRPVR